MNRYYISHQAIGPPVQKSQDTFSGQCYYKQRVESLISSLNLPICLIRSYLISIHHYGVHFASRNYSQHKIIQDCKSCPLNPIGETTTYVGKLCLPQWSGSK